MHNNIFTINFFKIIFIIPRKYSELYTNGNWFSAVFLFIFTWLAFSFIVSNPPLADIAPPTLAGGIDIEQTEGIEETSWKNGVYTINLNQDTVEVVMGMAVRDNVDAESVNINAVMYYRGEMIELLFHIQKKWRCLIQLITGPEEIK